MPSFYTVYSIEQARVLAFYRDSSPALRDFILDNYALLRGAGYFQQAKELPSFVSTPTNDRYERARFDRLYESLAETRRGR